MNVLFSCKGGGSGGVQGPGWRVSEMGSEDVNEEVNECIVLLLGWGVQGRVQGPGWRVSEMGSEVWNENGKWIV